jgi:hypothetical protein
VFALHGIFDVEIETKMGNVGRRPMATAAEMEMKIGNMGRRAHGGGGGNGDENGNENGKCGEKAHGDGGSGSGAQKWKLSTRRRYEYTADLSWICGLIEA